VDEIQLAGLSGMVYEGANARFQQILKTMTSDVGQRTDAIQERPHVVEEHINPLEEHTIAVAKQPIDVDAIYVDFDTSNPGDRFFVRFQQVMQERCFFRTKSNLLGIGPKAMKHDDCVVVMFGCKVPLVLRPVVEDTYRIVGECYVFEVNEGTASQEWRESGMPSTDFVIV
jgi:hypothetical protein